MKIRKGDNVFVIAGKDYGKSGQVTKVLPKENKIMVTGINIAKHHLKHSRKNPHGGIIDMPSPIDTSNVLLNCPHCGKPVRVGYKENAKVKERICRKCHGNLDAGEKNATT